MTKKVVVLELNEVPFKVIDAFAAAYPHSCIARLLGESDQYLTYTEDRIQLDPWISWPTFHRGVPDELHQVLHLGQDTAEANDSYPPIWQMLKDGGRKVGVFGSLHSCSTDKKIDDYEFFLADFFAPKADAHPERLVPLQRFNLQMTRESARNVSGKLPLKEGVSFVAQAAGLGVGLDTATGIAQQLASEVINKRTRIRRRNTQCALLADVFVNELKLSAPDYASFYTNHVAAAMHRYWAAAFPQDQIGPPLDADWLADYRDEVFEAMRVFDQSLRKVVSFCESEGDYTLVIASSLGQASIPTRHSDKFLTIVDLDKFMAALGATEYSTAPTMVPDFAITAPSETMPKVLANLRSFQINGNRMEEQASRMAHAHRRAVGDLEVLAHEVQVGEDFKPPLAFDVRENRTLHLSFQWDDYDGPKTVMIGNVEYSFEDAGLGYSPHQDRVNCSAQHIAEGSMIVWPRTKPPGERKAVSTLDFAPSVLRHFGISTPGYMNKRPRISFEPAVVAERMLTDA